jgi:hypothetical protein
MFLLPSDDMASSHDDGDQLLQFRLRCPFREPDQFLAVASHRYHPCVELRLQSFPNSNNPEYLNFVNDSLRDGSPMLRQISIPSELTRFACHDTSFTASPILRSITLQVECLVPPAHAINHHGQVRQQLVVGFGGLEQAINGNLNVADQRNNNNNNVSGISVSVLDGISSNRSLEELTVTLCYGLHRNALYVMPGNGDLDNHLGAHAMHRDILDCMWRNILPLFERLIAPLDRLDDASPSEMTFQKLVIQFDIRIGNQDWNNNNNNSYADNELVVPLYRRLSQGIRDYILSLLSSRPDSALPSNVQPQPGDWTLARARTNLSHISFVLASSDQQDSSALTNIGANSIVNSLLWDQSISPVLSWNWYNQSFLRDQRRTEQLRREHNELIVGLKGFTIVRAVAAVNRGIVYHHCTRNHPSDLRTANSGLIFDILFNYTTQS